MSIDEKKIKEFFKSRIEHIRKFRYKAEAVRELSEKNNPISRTIAQVWEAFLGDAEDQCKMNEYLMLELVQGRKRWNIVFEWIEYFKAEINHLKTTSPTVSAKPVETDKKVKALEKRQQDWEKKYKPVLEHLRIWMQRAEERQKRARQTGLV